MEWLTDTCGPATRLPCNTPIADYGMLCLTGDEARGVGMVAEYDDWDATAMAAAVASGDVTASELLDEALRRVAERNSALNAVVLIREETACSAIAAGLPDGPMRGVPFLLKDLGCEAVDFPSHNGSRLLANTTYRLDSAIFDRIRATGAVTFGRTTSPEGGIGPATESAVYGGPTRNPWDLTRTPGGSSGGAGAAVAAGIVPAAHGSDGGGSVRIPASSCGLFGLQADAGAAAGRSLCRRRLGRDGDRRVPHPVRPRQRGAARCLRGRRFRRALLGAAARPGLPGRHRSARPGRLRIALCETTLTGEAIHPDCRDAVLDAAALLESLGHRVEPARPRRTPRA